MSFKRYNEWVERIKQAGSPLTTYNCPECDFVITTVVPEDVEQFDTMATCPACHELHFKIVKQDGSVTLIHSDGSKSAA